MAADEQKTNKMEKKNIKKMFKRKIESAQRRDTSDSEESWEVSA